MRTGKEKPPARRPGRPSGDGGADQRERLLDAALALYVGNGVAATTLRDVAAASGVTPALLGYYFGGREALLQAVAEERLLVAIDELRAALDLEAGDSLKLVEGFVRGVHAVVARHPWLPTLWVREVLGEGGAFRRLLLTRIAPKLPLELARRFANGQAGGELATGLDPRLLVVSLVGLTLFPLAAAPLWRELFDIDDVADDQLLRHTLALLQNGLEP